MLDKKDLIFGMRPLMEALDSGKNISRVLWQAGLSGELSQALRRRLSEKEIPVQQVPVTRLNRITRGNHQGVIAFLSEIEYARLEMVVQDVFEKGETPLILILDRVTDVRNFGAIARSAECAGVHAIVIPDKGGATVTADAVRTSAGALFRVPVCRVKRLNETVRFLQASGLIVTACTEKGAPSVFDVDFTVPTAIVMGSEQDGISHDLIKICDHLARIPMRGKTGSLNVSVAAGVILFEVLRQQSLHKD
jgi:23S rRNA (guanosine2251-2'-O)-methyltransferase